MGTVRVPPYLGVTTVGVGVVVVVLVGVAEVGAVVVGPVVVAAVAVGAAEEVAGVVVSDLHAGRSSMDNTSMSATVKTRIFFNLIPP